MFHDIPMPGDWVRAAYPNPLGLLPGTLGVIQGRFGILEDAYSVVFHPTTPYDDRQHVSASGGPVPRIGIGALRPTGETMRVKTWRWHSSDVFRKVVEDDREVAVWEWLPPAHQDRVDRAREILAFWESCGYPDIVDAKLAREFLDAL